jgi:hypothetical protein
MARHPIWERLKTYNLINNSVTHYQSNSFKISQYGKALVARNSRVGREDQEEYKRLCLESYHYCMIGAGWK